MEFPPLPIAARIAARRFTPYLGGVLASGLAALLVVPTYTRVLGPSGFGVLEMVIALVALGQAVLLLGSDTALAILLHRTSDAAERSSVVKSGIRLTLAAGAAWGAGGLGVGLLLRWDGYILVALLASALAPGYAFAAAALRHLDRGAAFLGASISHATVTVAVGMAGVLALDLGVAGATLGLAAGTVTGLLVASWALRDQLTSPRHGSIGVSTLMRVALPAVGASAGLWILGYADRFLLAGLASVEEVGFYGAAWKISLGVSLIVSAFLLAWVPHALRTQRDPDAPRFYAAGLLAFICAGSAVMVLAATFAEPLVAVIAGPAFAPAAPLVWILVGSAILFGAAGMAGVPLQIAHRPGQLGWTTMAGAAAKVLLLVLVADRLGAPGAAMATAVGYAVVVVAVLIAGQRAYPVPHRLAELTVVTATAIAASYLLSAGGLPGPAQVAIGLAVAGGFGLLATRRLRAMIPVR